MTIDGNEFKPIPKPKTVTLTLDDARDLCSRCRELGAVFPWLDVAIAAAEREGRKEAEHDIVLTAYAERAGGPGWGNGPIWVIIQDRNGVLRRECLQPNEQSPALRANYWVSDALNVLMRGEATEALRKRANGKVDV